MESSDTTDERRTQPNEEATPTDPSRIKGFARFFKNYMSLSALVAASLPIPVTAFGLIPVFAAHKLVLSVYTPMFCFLLLGFAFYSRHQLARVFFPRVVFLRERVPETVISQSDDESEPVVEGRRRAGMVLIVMKYLPLLLIVVTMVLIYCYHFLLDQAVASIVDRGFTGSSVALDERVLSREEFNAALKESSGPMIPYTGLIMMSYLGIFLCAEGAFILMAIKEYLQDLLGITEKELIYRRSPQGSAGEKG